MMITVVGLLVLYGCLETRANLGQDALFNRPYTREDLIRDLQGITVLDVGDARYRSPYRAFDSSTYLGSYRPGLNNDYYGPYTPGYPTRRCSFPAFFQCLHSSYKSSPYNREPIYDFAQLGFQNRLLDDEDAKLRFGRFGVQQAASGTGNVQNQNIMRGISNDPSNMNVASDTFQQAATGTGNVQSQNVKRHNDFVKNWSANGAQSNQELSNFLQQNAGGLGAANDLSVQQAAIGTGNVQNQMIRRALDQSQALIGNGNDQKQVHKNDFEGLQVIAMKAQADQALSDYVKQYGGGGNDLNQALIGNRNKQGQYGRRAVYDFASLPDFAMNAQADLPLSDYGIKQYPGWLDDLNQALIGNKNKQDQYGRRAAYDFTSLLDFVMNAQADLPVLDYSIKQYPGRRDDLNQALIGNRNKEGQYGRRAAYGFASLPDFTMNTQADQALSSLIRQNGAGLGVTNDWSAQQGAVGTGNVQNQMIRRGLDQSQALIGNGNDQPQVRKNDFEALHVMAMKAQADQALLDYIKQGAVRDDLNQALIGNKNKQGQYGRRAAYDSTSLQDFAMNKKGNKVLPGLIKQNSAIPGTSKVSIGIGNKQTQIIKRALDQLQAILGNSYDQSLVHQNNDLAVLHDFAMKAQADQALSRLIQQYRNDPLNDLYRGNKRFAPGNAFFNGNNNGVTLNDGFSSANDYSIMRVQQAASGLGNVQNQNVQGLRDEDVEARFAFNPYGSPDGGLRAQQGIQGSGNVQNEVINKGIVFSDDDMGANLFGMPSASPMGVQQAARGLQNGQSQSVRGSMDGMKVQQAAQGVGNLQSQSVNNDLGAYGYGLGPGMMGPVRAQQAASGLGNVQSQSINDEDGGAFNDEDLNVGTSRKTPNKRISLIQAANGVGNVQNQIINGPQFGRGPKGNFRETGSGFGGAGGGFSGADDGFGGAGGGFGEPGAKGGFGGAGSFSRPVGARQGMIVPSDRPARFGRPGGYGGGYGSPQAYGPGRYGGGGYGNRGYDGGSYGGGGYGGGGYESGGDEKYQQAAIGVGNVQDQTVSKRKAIHDEDVLENW